MKSERWYHEKLQRYFDRNFGPYGETAEWYNNPAPNKWKFIIPELEIVVTLTCNNIGWVIEKRDKID